MNALKPGDRVHIEFEADVVLADADGVKVYHDGADWRVPTEFCKVIVPPIKVGDVVTLANVDQLTAGSIVARPKETPYWTHDGHWFAWTDTRVYRSDVAIDCRVLRIGGGDQ